MAAVIFAFTFAATIAVGLLFYWCSGGRHHFLQNSLTAPPHPPKKLKLHFDNTWLRKHCDEDAECEAGPGLIETLDLLVRVVDTKHPDASAALTSASLLRFNLLEQGK